jgi:Glycosyl hydrolases family 18
MSRWVRFGVPLLLVAVVSSVAFGTLLFDTPFPTGAVPSGDSGQGSGDAALPTIPPSPTPRPGEGGTELYGYLPYWQVTEEVATYLEDAPLSTLAMFSVTARRNGAINTSENGYRHITGDLGRRLVKDAQRRGTRVELVFTSFGERKNGIFFGRLPLPGGASSNPGATQEASPAPSPTAGALEAPWQRTVIELALLVDDLGVDGINVDVEQLDELDRDAYAEFLRSLRTALLELVPEGTITVASEAGLRGIGNALAAVEAGADRIFLMGYDYHWSGSAPGASSPVDRSDGLYTLRWSIEQYVGAGVPRDRILLGLPLYGMSWKTIGPDRTSSVLGRGSAWIPSQHKDVLLDPLFVPGRDTLEVAEFFVRPEGRAWRLTYYDSPATLRAKLALARDQGLAGGGFWAIGYERGLPGYLELMRDFRTGDVGREEAPPPP